jgi:hypothetical protein
MPEVPPSYEIRLAALEARVLRLEARLGAAPAPSGAPLGDDSEAWLNDVADLARRGDRAGAVAAYLRNMAGSDEAEAASFVDGLISDPPAGT